MIGLVFFSFLLETALGYSYCIYYYSYDSYYSYGRKKSYCIDTYNADSYNSDYYYSLGQSALSIGSIVGIVIGSLVGLSVLISICVGVVYCMRRRPNRGQVMTPGQPMVSCVTTANQGATGANYPQPYVNTGYATGQPMMPFIPYEVTPPEYTPDTKTSADPLPTEEPEYTPDTKTSADPLPTEADQTNVAS